MNKLIGRLTNAQRNRYMDKWRVWMEELFDGWVDGSRELLHV